MSRTIQESLRDAMRAAMRAGNMAVVETVRAVSTAVAEELTAKNPTKLEGDDLYRDVINKYVRKLSKAREEFAAILAEDGADSRVHDLDESYAAEIKFLDPWVEKMFSEEETRRIVLDAIVDLAADTINVGRVMGTIMRENKGKIDGKLAKKLIKEVIGAGS